eukprot:TRINITY_DN16566_c0_g1_i1.p1 TRINITY_DN16566_c0_g1~~TRINITY_DN16566_c0_g1_i1.p1  ORF type:complete len:645 (+),score=142.39 TRINITY_DN16566_c0_g1_i1:101-2035(+)
MSIRIGFDFGTTFSVAIGCTPRNEFIHFGPFPSTVFFESASNVAVGVEAEKWRKKFPGTKDAKDKRYVHEIKRLLGLSWSNYENSELMKLEKLCYDLEPMDQGNGLVPGVQITWDDGSIAQFSAEEIARKIVNYGITGLLAKMNINRDDVELDAVVTYPAHFETDSKEALRSVFRSAGVNVVDSVTEPVAAVIDLCGGTLKPIINRFQETGVEEINIMVFDLGGGTFDICVLEYDPEFESSAVVCQKGKRYLGGCDFSNSIIERVKGEMFPALRSTLDDDEAFRYNCNEAKLILSKKESTMIHIPALGLKKEFCRDDFDACIGELLEGAFVKLNAVIKEVEEKGKTIHAVVPVGGSCHIPYVKKRLRTAFKDPITKIVDNENMELNVARGALIRSLSKDEDRQHNATEKVPGENMCLTDTIALDIGAQVFNISENRTKFDRLLPAGRIYPATKTEVYSKRYPNATSISITILEGQSEDVEKNYVLGTFKMSVSANPGAEIIVTFDMKADGSLNVKARENGTSHELDVDITREGTHSMSDEQITQLKNEAIRNRKNDIRRSENREKIRELQNLVDVNKAHCLTAKIQNDIRGEIMTVFDNAEIWMERVEVMDPIPSLSTIEEMSNSVQDKVQKLMMKSLQQNTRF